MPILCSRIDGLLLAVFFYCRFIYNFFCTFSLFRTCFFFCDGCSFFSATCPIRWCRRKRRKKKEERRGKIRLFHFCQWISTRTFRAFFIFFFFSLLLLCFVPFGCIKSSQVHRAYFNVEKWRQFLKWNDNDIAAVARRRHNIYSVSTVLFFRASFSHFSMPSSRFYSFN